VVRNTERGPERGPERERAPDQARQDQARPDQQRSDQPEMATPETPAELAAAAQAAQYRPDPTAGYKTDVIDPRGSDDTESTLVDTPESRIEPAAPAPRAAPRPRARKPKPVADQADSAAEALDTSTDAAE
jgi:hypothetical protein